MKFIISGRQTNYLCTLVNVTTVLAVIGEIVAFGAFTREGTNSVTAAAIATNAE